MSIDIGSWARSKGLGLGSGCAGWPWGAGVVQGVGNAVGDGSWVCQWVSWEVASFIVMLVCGIFGVLPGFAPIVAKDCDVAPL